MHLGLWAKDLLTHFLSILLQSDKVAAVSPAGRSEPPASCLISLPYPGRERLWFISGPQPPSALSPMTLLPLLLPGVVQGCILVGSHELCWSLAIPVRSALEGGPCGCTFSACSSGYAFSVCSPWSSCVE